MSTADFFEKNRYAYIKNALPLHKCDQYTKALWASKLMKDCSQCPGSTSSYTEWPLARVHYKMVPELSSILGLELAPTYVFSRIYKKGSDLGKHKDRPSCEISTTLTLGVSNPNSNWPIYFQTKDGNKAFNISVGDMVAYRGEELWHWRDPLQDDWQVQVFFHFIDKNGPHYPEFLNDRGRNDRMYELVAESLKLNN